MEQVAINNASQVMPTIPAGVALRDVTGFGIKTLSTSEGAADIIMLSGVVAAAGVIVVVPTPSVPNQVIGTFPAAGGLAAGWTKIFRNNTTGPGTLQISGPLGAPLAALAQCQSQMVWSPDGLTVFAANAQA